MHYPTQPAVYRITHQHSGSYYIGSTNNLNHRVTQHLDHLQRGSHHNRALQGLYKDSSELRFDYLTYSTIDEAHAEEQRQLDIYHGTPGCLNVGSGVVGPWTRGVPDEQREKMNAGFREYARSDEFRAKRRELMLGNKVSEEQKIKTSLALTGIKRSEETRKKLSTAQQNRAARNREQFGGVGMSPEQREKLSRAHSKAVLIDGVKYNSKKEAAAAHGIVVTSVTNRINSNDPKFAGWVNE